MAGQGHNSLAADQLRQYVERIERLERERADLKEDVSSVYAEAKGAGFDVKILRTVIRRRKLDAADRQRIDETTALYESIFD